jgi:DNA-binding transcriptional regulator YhcF (GntR family)
MKRKRIEETELNEVVQKMKYLEPTLKRKYEEECEDKTNKRIRTNGTFAYTIDEYKKIIVSLYKQNVRLLNRAKVAEEAHENLIQEIKKRGLESRKWQRPCSPQNIPTVVM